MTETAPVVDPHAAAVAANTATLLHLDPALIPAQFNGDAAAAMTAYTNLQGAYTKGQQEIATLKAAAVVVPTTPVPPVAPVPPVTTAPVAPVTPTVPVVPATAPVAPGIVQIPAAPVAQTVTDWDAVAKGMRVTGDIDAPTRASLIAAGYTDQTVTQFAAGQKALMANERTAAVAIVGTEQDLANVTAWAAKTLTDTQKNTLNEGLAGPHAEMILAGLNQQYIAATRKEGGGVPEVATVGSADPNANTMTFIDQREVTQAMADPKYRTDHKYRAAVEAACGAFYANAGASQISIKRRG